MARKTNKTAHVLNLISKAKDEHQSTEEQMQIDNTGSDVSNDLLFMGIEPSNDKSISEKIAENLEILANQMENGDVPHENESIQPPAVTELSPKGNTPTPPEASSQEETVPQSPLVPEAPISTVQPEELVTDEAPRSEFPPLTASTTAEGISAPEVSKALQIGEDTPKTFHYVNVYEKLVLERLEEFQTMFDVCTCPRCTADVIALALTHLPAKYIVIDDPTVIPLLSFYRAKLKTPITTQLSSACVTVKEKPLHNI